VVPKARFELARPVGHYALNVARLPFRHFGTDYQYRPHWPRIQPDAAERLTTLPPGARSDGAGTEPAVELRPKAEDGVAPGDEADVAALHHDLLLVLAAREGDEGL
jgi:hypothetical protein